VGISSSYSYPYSGRYFLRHIFRFLFQEFPRISKNFQEFIIIKNIINNLFPLFPPGFYPGYYLGYLSGIYSVANFGEEKRGTISKSFKIPFLFWFTNMDSNMDIFSRTPCQKTPPKNFLVLACGSDRDAKRDIE